jgi:hypothetical protein
MTRPKSAVRRAPAGARRQASPAAVTPQNVTGMAVTP